MTIGEKIRTLRKQKGLTQKELGRLSHTSEGTIQQYESGKRQPRLAQLQLVASALSVRLEDVLELETFSCGAEFEKKWNEILSNDKNCCDSLTIVYQVADTKEDVLLNSFHKLNDNGQEKAVEQVEMLTKIEEYTKKDEL